MADSAKIKFPGISFLFLSATWFLFCTPFDLAGQNDDLQDFISSNIPVSNQNWEIYQNPANNYLYFANSAGLVEYNGISSRLFNMPYRKGIRSVYINSAGTIYTGSFEDFGYWKDDGNGGLSYRSISQDLDIPKNDEIWNISEMNNSVYFQSFTSIYRFDSAGTKSIPGPSNMLFMFRAGEKYIVQGIGTGLFWFDGSEFDFIGGSEMFGSMKVHALICWAPDEYWICTANDGIFLFDGRLFTKYKSKVSGFLEEQTCNAGLLINDSLAILGTILNGVIICDRNGRILKSFNYSNGLNNNTVLSLYRDCEGGLWIGLDDGASFFNINSPVINYSNTSGNLGTIYSAVRDRDRIYLGTNHGLFSAGIELDNGYFSFTNLRMISGTQGQVWMLAKFDDQLLCGHNEGTFLLDGNTISRISEVTGGWSMRQYNDLLFEGTYTGIITFNRNNEGKWKYLNRIKGYIEPSRSIEIDYQGYLWATHPQKGIYRLELNEQLDSVVNTLYFSSIENTSNRVSISKINNQVVFMTSENLYAFDYGNKTFSPLRSLEKGLGEYIKATQIIPYQKNSYWFVLGNKVALFDISRGLEAKKTLEFFHKFAELPGREQQVIPLDEKTILIPTRKAFTTIDVTKLGSEEASAVLIDRLLFSGKSTSTVIIPESSDSVAIPNRENNIKVFMADPSGYDQEEREYFYRIKELGDNWYSTNSDSFSFLNLKFGHYHVQVKSAAGEKVTEAGFTIKRPGYLSTPAIIGYLIIFSLLIFTGISIFTLELRRQKKLLEYEVGKSKLESELDSKSYELMLTMRYLIEKNEIMTELNDQIVQLKEQSSKYPQKFIREIERIINNGLNSQTEEWKNAMNSLKLSQQGFFKQLLEKYPDLTPNDLRLCSYLRMNFTTKEIAKLLNISGRAVEISRYRLRRKLNIDHDINLTEFLIRESETGDK